jgi:hypothetical protein
MIYCIASRLKTKEFLVLKAQSPFDAFHFTSIEEAKVLFQPYYEILGKVPINSSAYRTNLSRLMRIHPVIIGLDYDLRKARRAMNKWKDSGMTFTASLPIIAGAHLVVPMKEGFIAAFEEMDIVQDIESLTRIGEDGQIEVNKFHITHLWKGEKPSIEMLTREKGIAALKKKGLM